MGSSFSSIFSTLSNPETKTIINTLLKRLVTEVDMRDMYSLSDPKMCKEYIVVATTGLEQLFRAVRINKTKDGILLFQKIKGIQHANPDPVKQLQYCRELAFFYVRIFQIYAAIALSIMDSDIPDADPILVSKESRLERRGVVFVNPKEGFKGFKQRPVKSWGSWLFGQRGGEIAPGERENQYIPDTAAPYHILNKFLMPATDNTSPMRTRKPSSSRDYSVFITQESIYEFDTSGSRVRTTLPESRPRILYKSDEADMIIEGDDPIRVELNNFKIKGRDINLSRQREFSGDTIEDNFLHEIEEMFNEVKEELAITKLSIVDFLNSRRLITRKDITTPISGTNKVYILNPNESKGSSVDIAYKGYYKQEDRNRQITIKTVLTIKAEKGDLGQTQYRLRVITNNITTDPSELVNMLSIPYETSEDLMKGPTKLFSDEATPIDKEGRTIPAFLDRTFKAMLDEKEDYVTRDGIFQTREGLAEPLDSDSMPESMRIKGVWKALAKKPAVVAHCKARALQLLNIAAIKGVDKDAYSSMCLTKFPYAKDGSLPPGGQPITEEYGIKALSMLFVDMMDNGNPKVTSTEEYRQFRLKFKEYFERADLTDDSRAPGSFSDITEKLMPGVCKPPFNEQVMVGNAVSSLRQKAKQLFNRQAIHVRNSMRLLFKLFDEKSIRRGEFNVSSYVENQGMIAVDQIAEDTRNMLVEYYGDCEQTYKEGLYIMYNKHNKDPDSIKYRRVE